MKLSRRIYTDVQNKTTHYPACIHMVIFTQDFGEEHLTEVAKQMDFPWLMSNARLKKTGRRLADGHEKLILNCRGRKVSISVSVCSTCSVQHV